jgi:hypothetical protein
MASSSSNSRKRKPETIEDCRKALDAAKERNDSLHAILHMVKDHMQKKDEAHFLEVKMERKRAKLSLVEKILRGDLQNPTAEAQKLADATECLSSALADVKIPPIDWLKLGVKFM